MPADRQVGVPLHLNQIGTHSNQVGSANYSPSRYAITLAAE